MSRGLERRSGAGRRWHERPRGAAKLQEIILRVVSMNGDTQERNKSIHLSGLWNEGSAKDTQTVAQVYLTLEPYGFADRELIREFRIGDEVRLEIDHRFDS